MRRLFVALVVIMALSQLSQLPGISEHFKEEKEGVNAVVGKAEKAYSVAANAYDKAEQHDATAGAKATGSAQRTASKKGDATFNDPAAGVIRQIGSLANSVKAAIASEQDARIAGK